MDSWYSVLANNIICGWWCFEVGVGYYLGYLVVCCSGFELLFWLGVSWVFSTFVGLL